LSLLWSELALSFDHYPAFAGESVALGQSSTTSQFRQWRSSSSQSAHHERLAALQWLEFEQHCVLDNKVSPEFPDLLLMKPNTGLHVGA
jgi:hypothetical protein